MFSPEGQGAEPAGALNQGSEWRGQKLTPRVPPSEGSLRLPRAESGHPCNPTAHNQAAPRLGAGAIFPSRRPARVRAILMSRAWRRGGQRALYMEYTSCLVCAGAVHPPV